VIPVFAGGFGQESGLRPPGRPDSRAGCLSSGSDTHRPRWRIGTARARLGQGRRADNWFIFRKNFSEIPGKPPEAKEKPIVNLD
jgi:hypothetical protein